MESIDPANLASVNKGFNKPGEYAKVLQTLADRNIYAVTSFMFGVDNDTPGVVERTLKADSHLAAGLARSSDCLTPLPAILATLSTPGCEAARTPDASEALARVCTVRNGAYAVENERRGSA